MPGTGCCSGADAHGRAALTLDAARNGGGEGNLCGSRQSVRQSTGGKTGMNEWTTGAWRRCCEPCCIAHGPGTAAHSCVLWKSALNASILARALASYAASRSEGDDGPSEMRP